LELELQIARNGKKEEKRILQLKSHTLTPVNFLLVNCRQMLPCFEGWLLLHYKKMGKNVDEIAKVFLKKY